MMTTDNVLPTEEILPNWTYLFISTKQFIFLDLSFAHIMIACSILLRRQIHRRSLTRPLKTEQK